MKKLFVFVLFLVLSIANVPLISASEQRTVVLNPIADSYVLSTKPTTNYGRELNFLSAFYEDSVVYISSTSFTVSPGIVYYTVSDISSGTSLDGSFTVTAGGNLDIDFYITDDLLYGTKHAFLSRSTGSSFSFTAPVGAKKDYYIVFDNSFSWITSKTVSLSDVTRTNWELKLGFLKFDLGQIPPDATIILANLSLYASSVHSASDHELRYCKNSSWTEDQVTYMNAPLSGFNDFPRTLAKTVDVKGTWYSWDVSADVVRAIPNQYLTEIVYPLAKGGAEFFSKESINKTKLEIVYTYASIEMSLSYHF